MLRPGHALAPGGRAKARSAKAAPVLTAIGGYPLVLPLAGTLIRQVADGFLSRHGISPQAGLVETLDTSLARSLVLQGDNLWFTPAGAVLLDLATGVLLQLCVALTPEEPVGLILRTEPETSPTVLTFVSAVRAQAAAGRMRRKRRLR